MPPVTDAPPPKDFKHALAHFRGVACESRFFSFAGDAPPTTDDLRAVAQRTVERVVQDWIASARPKNAKSIRSSNQIDTTRLAAATPRQISWDEFLGPQWASPTLPNVTGDGRPLNYTTAFAATPHGIGLHKTPLPQSWWSKLLKGPHPDPVSNEDEQEREFRRLMTAVLRNAVGAEIGSDRVTIWQWPTDWSAYFDAGHEWWGAACWTIWTAPDRLLGIVASTTD